MVTEADGSASILTFPTINNVEDLCVHELAD